MDIKFHNAVLARGPRLNLEKTTKKEMVYIGTFKNTINLREFGVDMDNVVMSFKFRLVTNAEYKPKQFLMKAISEGNKELAKLVFDKEGKPKIIYYSSAGEFDTLEDSTKLVLRGHIVFKSTYINHFFFCSLF